MTGFSASRFGPPLRRGASLAAVGLVGLLRPVCCWARHHARGLGRSPTGAERLGGVPPSFFVGYRFEFALALIRGFPSAAAC